MQNNIYIKLLSIAVFMLFSTITFAQSETKFQHKRWEGGPLFTRVQYQGDMSTANIKKEFNN